MKNHNIAEDMYCILVLFEGFLMTKSTLCSSPWNKLNMTLKHQFIGVIASFTFT